MKGADARLGETEQALLFDAQTGYLNLQGEEALKQAPTVLDAYREAQAREMAALTDGDQRQMLQGLVDRRLVSFSTQVEHHSLVERQRWYDQASEQRIVQMQADAGFYWSDDALLRRALGTTRAEVRDKAERRGWDSALTEKALRQHTSRTLVSAIETAVDRDLERAQALRTRYAAVIEDQDRTTLDAFLAEARTRQRVEAASTEILNATPPDSEQPTQQWRLRQADAITDAAVRAAVVRRLDHAVAADDARARALAEQVLARVLKEGLTDPSQVAIRDWVALDALRRQAIEIRIDHHARGTEPNPNPVLVDELATEMTQAPQVFARRDLVPAVAHLPFAQWQRFRDWQAGLRRNDPTTEDEVYAIKRGFQIARQTPPGTSPAHDSDKPSPTDAQLRAALVDEIDVAHKLNGKSPDDATLRGIVRRSLPVVPLHNISIPPLDLEAARRLARLPGQVVDELALFTMWLFVNSVILQLRANEMASPQSSPVPTPAGDRKSTIRTAAPNVPEVQAGSEAGWSRGSPPARFDKTRTNRTATPPPPTTLPGTDIDAPKMPTILKGPEIGALRPPTTLPGADIDAPRMPTILKGPEIDAPRPPTILPGPDINAPQHPTIYASQGAPGNDGEPWDEHHHIPQELWAEGKPNRIEFREEVIEYFKSQTVWLPKDEHWSYLHEAYNRMFRRALLAYLAEHKKDSETEHDFARRMTKEDAIAAYKHVLSVILNPPGQLGEDKVGDAEKAKEFLDNVSWYVQQQQAASVKEVAK